MCCFWWGAGIIFFLLYIGKWREVEQEYLLVWYWLFNSNIYSMVDMGGNYIYSREVGRLLKFQGLEMWRCGVYIK